MDKPKQLTGEVKRFINEVVLERHQEKLLPSYYKQLLDNRTLRAFYNQPFKPEMITEYFKGWKISKEKNGLNIECKPKYYIDWKTGDIPAISFHYYPNPFPFLIFFRDPEILSDFITLAISAGITLRWK